MIFNLEKNNNRSLIDIGDLKSYFLKSIITCRQIDRKTVASVVAIFDYLEKVFIEKQPKAGTVYPIVIQEAFLNKELKRVLKKNQSLDKKKGEVLGLDEEAEILLPHFTEEQIAQLQSLIQAQNEAIKRTFEESVKKITVNVIAEPANPKKEPEKAKEQTVSK